MSTVFSISAYCNVHDVNVESKKGRHFIIDIYEANASSYNSTVTVLDRVSTPSGSWLYKTTPSTESANNNFKAAIELIQKYLISVDQTDSIINIHNPCNCPFVRETDQKTILSELGVNVNVRVN